ncbi:MAG: D-alanine--D-alanine ligase family protein [Acidobacteriota bacterium]
MTEVGLVFGGRSVEHRVSVRSARTVAQALEAAGYVVRPLAIAEDGSWASPQVAAAALAGEIEAIAPSGEAIAPSLAARFASPPEVIFPIVHGTWGEDGTLQGLCEMLDLPYVGAGVAASAVAMDKLAAKRILAAAGVPVVDYESARRGESATAVAERSRRLGSPWFVKPAVGGSSVGIRKVVEAADLAVAVEFAWRFDEAVVIERGVAGRELECAVLGYPELEASVVGEIVPGGDFYDYEDKYLTDAAELIAPAPLPDGVAERLRACAVKAFAALGGHGMARVDFFLEGEELWLNEINTLPGFTSISMYPRLWGLSGVPLGALVGRLVEAALARHRDRSRLDRGIKEWLAALDGS